MLNYQPYQAIKIGSILSELTKFIYRILQGSVLSEIINLHMDIKFHFHFYIAVLLPILNLSCLPAVIPIEPGVVTLISNALQFLHSTHQSLSQSNILAIVLPLRLLRSGINSLMMCTAQHQLPPSGKSSKLGHSLPCHPCVSFVRPGFVIGLTFIALFMFRCDLESVIDGE